MNITTMIMYTWMNISTVILYALNDLYRVNPIYTDNLFTVTSI